MLKSNLDKRICDVSKTGTNTQTFREFIRESERAFDIAPEDLDNMSEKELNKYLDFLDELWCK